MADKKNKNRKTPTKVQDLTPSKDPKGGALADTTSTVVKNLGDALSAAARKG